MFENRKEYGQIYHVCLEKKIIIIESLLTFTFIPIWSDTHHCRTRDMKLQYPPRGTCLPTYFVSWAIKLAIWSCKTFNWEAAVAFIEESNSWTPNGSLSEINLPSPTLISKFVPSSPLLFLVTVAITEPAWWVSKGDPFAELEIEEKNRYRLMRGMKCNQQMPKVVTGDR